MVEYMLWTVHESLVQGYCATADCATGDCARLRNKRYYCTTGKEKNTTSYACNTSSPSPEGHPDLRYSLSWCRLRQELATLDVVEGDKHDCSADQKHHSHCCEEGDMLQDGEEQGWAVGQKADAWYWQIPV